MNRKLKSGLIRRSAVLAVFFMLAAAQTVLADDTGKFVTGTKVNGIGIGGLTVEEAKTRIEGFYSSQYNLTITEQGKKTETIKGSSIGYRMSAPVELQPILDAQNASGRAAGPEVDNSHTLSMNAEFDENALNGAIQGLSCISGTDITVTADAHISAYQEGQPFAVIPEVYGNDVDVEKTSFFIREAVKNGLFELNLEAYGCYRAVNVTKDDTALAALCDNINRCRDMVIVYKFGEQTVELKGDTITSWIIGSTADGLTDVDYNLAAGYINSLADQFDTAGKIRTFHTALGKDVDLTGPYGWQIDRAGETAALIAMIRTAQSQEREPLYTKTAQDRTSDWGKTYAEIDLTGQHVYMYQEGALVWEAPCVTGNVSKNYTTPEGIYSLAYKEKDRILRGEKKDDGSYEYESHVNYWMPFNGGIGFHDADWRSKFGGTIYQYSGSHGCVNLPPAMASKLYDLIYTGMPVICYN